MLKKVGAGLVIVILTVMMGLTFSSQPLSEITDIISGTNQLGEFKGKAISSRLYYMVRENCKDRYREYGQIPDVFIDQCAEREIKGYYLIPSITSHLGLGVSDYAVEQQILRAVRNSYEAQTRYADPDDRLTMNEVYMREMQGVPPEIRRKSLEMEKSLNAMMDFPFPSALAESALDAKEIRVDLRVIDFDNAELLSHLGKTIKISEEEIRTRYEEKEAAKKDGDEKSDYKSSHELIENEIRNERRQKELASIKSKLGSLNKPDIAAVQNITGISPQFHRNIQLQNLKALKIGPGANSKVLNLTSADFLMELGKGISNTVVGPIQSQERTVYVEVVAVKNPGKVHETRELEVEARQGGMYLASGLLDLLADREAEKYGFHMFTSGKAQ